MLEMMGQFERLKHLDIAWSSALIRRVLGLHLSVGQTMIFAANRNEICT
jgi:hypothetical protein